MPASRRPRRRRARSSVASPRGTAPSRRRGYAHGSSRDRGARARRLVPGGDRRAPRPGPEAGQAAAGAAGPADPVVRDSISEPASVPREPHGGGRARRVLGRVGQGLAGDEVGRELDRLAARSRSRTSTAVGTGERAASDVSAGPSPSSSTAGWRPRASSRSSARNCSSHWRRPPAPPPVGSRPTPSGRFSSMRGHQPLLRAVVQVPLQPPPLGVARLDDPLPRLPRELALPSESPARGRWWRRPAAGFDQRGVVVGAPGRRRVPPPLGLPAGSAGRLGRTPAAQ